MIDLKRLLFQILSLVLYLGIVVLFSYWSMTAFLKYRSQPKATEIIHQMGEENNEYYLKFPIITVCECVYKNPYHSWKRTSNECYDESKSTFISFIKCYLNMEHDELISDIMKNISIEQKDVILKVKAYFDTNTPAISLENKWTSVFNRNHGKCFSLDLSKTALSNMAAEVFIYT